MGMRRVWLALLLVGCKLPFATPKRDAGAPPIATTPPAPTGKALTPRWSDFDARFAELPSASVMFMSAGMSYEMRFNGFPSGTTITMSGKSTALSSTGYTQSTDISDLVADLSPADALSYSFKLDPKIECELGVPGYVPLTVKAPAKSVSFAVRDAMSKAIDHPVLFKGEAVTDPPIAAHSILYTGPVAEAYGPASRLRDVDWIAVVDKLPARKGKTCATTKTTPLPGRAAPPPSIVLDLVDEDVLIVERKTSKIISRKTFSAKTDCPSYVGVGSATYPDELVMKRWVRDERAAH